MAWNTGKTMRINDLLMNCDNIEDFKGSILVQLQSQKYLWLEKIQEILNATGISQSELAKRCDVSRATVLKWVRGSLPQSRDMFIRIGLAAGYNLDEMNRFLVRFGRYPELYSKSLEDCIYMFVLNSDSIDHTYAACKTVFDRVDCSIYPEKSSQSAPSSDRMETIVFKEYVLGITAISELKEFIASNGEIFRSSYAKFYDYVKDFVRRNNESYFENENADSIHYLAETLEWSSSLKQCVYAIYQNEWFPRRNKVISLGIHLNMTLDEINEMLSLAKMEKMYAVNPVECIIMYALMDAELCDAICPGTDDLYQHVVEVFDELEIEEKEYRFEDYIG